MLDPKRLLTDFLGGNAGNMWDQAAGKARSATANVDRKQVGTFAAGAAAGSIVGLLLGSKKAKKIGGNLLTYGGAAVLGGLAYKAWQNYQGNKQPAATGAPAEVLPPPTDSPFNATVTVAADGKPFALALVRAMIAAAKADGHIDAAEQKSLFERIETLGLDAEAKAFVFDELSRPTDLNAIAALPQGQEQAAEIWLVSRLAIDPDDVREKAYLTALGAKLDLPPQLLEHLESQAVAALPAPDASRQSA
ncbi:MAG TPA: tellurite resistance TerB family protein [Dongiaceae bacterium]|nr:tellurite resistance TerB family protein [Dongiaceae bacterium]